MKRFINNLPNINFVLTILLVYFGFIHYGIILSSLIALLSGLFIKNSEKTILNQAYSEYGFFLLFIVLGFFQWGIIPLGITTFLSYMVGLYLSSKKDVFKIISSLILFSFISIGSIYVPAYLAKSQLHETVSETIEPFYFYDLNNNYISSEDLNGKVIVLNFWATWCHTCRREMPKFKKASERFINNPNVVFVAVNSGGSSDTYEKVKNFIEQNDYSFKVVMDGNSSTIFEIDALPSLVILDKNGILRVKHMGYSPAEDFENYLINEVKRLL